MERERFRTCKRVNVGSFSDSHYWSGRVSAESGQTCKQHIIVFFSSSWKAALRLLSVFFWISRSLSVFEDWRTLNHFSQYRQIQTDRGLNSVCVRVCTVRYTFFAQKIQNIFFFLCSWLWRASINTDTYFCLTWGCTDTVLIMRFLCIHNVLKKNPMERSSKSEFPHNSQNSLT